MNQKISIMILLSVFLVNSCGKDPSTKENKLMSSQKIGDIFLSEKTRLLLEAKKEAERLSQTTKNYLENRTEENLLIWQKNWISAHQSFIETTFLLNSENYSKIESWPITPGFLDSLEDYPYSGIVNDTAIEISPQVLEDQHMITDPSEISLGFHVLEYYAFERNQIDLNTSKESEPRRRKLIALTSDMLVKEISKLGTAIPKSADISYPDLIATIKEKVELLYFEVRSGEHSKFSNNTEKIIRFELEVLNILVNDTFEINKYIYEASPELGEQLTYLLEDILEENITENSTNESRYLDRLIPKLLELQEILIELEIYISK